MDLFRLGQNGRVEVGEGPPGEIAVAGPAVGRGELLDAPEAGNAGGRGAVGSRPRGWIAVDSGLDGGFGEALKLRSGGEVRSLWEGFVV